MGTKVKIGIDPDVHKSGYCIVVNDKIYRHSTAEFFDMLDILKITHGEGVTDLTVVIEGGWLNKRSNWHASANATTAQRIAKNVGANHQIGKLFVEYCEKYNIPFQIVKPKGKVNEKYLKALTGLTVKNQDVRDAIMLVYGMNN